MSSPQLRRLLAMMQRSTARVYATWNPSDKGSAITLSNGNLTTTQTTSAGTARATIGVSTGKWQWEITLGSTAGNFGIATSAALTSNWCGQDSHGWAIYSGDGKVYNSNAGTGSFGTFGNGDVITFLLDMTVANSGTLKAKKNGVLMGTLVSSLNGQMFPAIGNLSSADIATANFGATALLYPDAGYNTGLYI